ncbi:MAG TPA: hypothetical protein VN722_03460 [Hanamia sp.]|jgi:hypothetical protein|nr:hypothetical protein [Hanamia sp.]
MKNVLKCLILVCSISLFASCKKDSKPAPTPTPVKLDSAAQSFITSSAITDTAQQSAINTLVVQLKQNNLWNKFLAIYPMVGGTTATTKLNLKDPRDLDQAFRITWNGTPQFQATGVTCLNSTDWGDTHLSDSLLAFDNSSISFYSGTQNQTAGYDMGCSNQVSPYNMIAVYEDFTKDIVNTWFNAYDSVPSQPSSTVGLFTNSSSTGKVVRYVNGTVNRTYGAPANGHTDMNITIGKVVDDPGMGLKECRFAAIGQGLSDAEALSFYNIVKAYQTKLNR